jgi:predicted ATPase/class 3 adenylate cyclase
MALPSGTVTFLFSDIAGSTRLLEELGAETYASALARHRHVLREAFSRNGGREVDTQGDAFFVAFQSAHEAVHAALQAQRELSELSWPGGVPLRVRIGLHTGEALLGTDGYVGYDVHRAKRICDAGHGGQILLSQTTADLIAASFALKDLGVHRLKDLSEPQRLYQLHDESLPSEFPPVRSLAPVRSNLPFHRSTFVGREREIHRVEALLGESAIVTLIGPGGSGKTRLAIEAARSVGRPDGVVLAELAPVCDAALVPHAVAQALDIKEERGRPLAATIRDALRTNELLVVLDNCEHVLGACASLADSVLRACAGVQILATSREPLGVEGEVTLRVPPLTLPTVEESDPARSEAVRLFIERARAARPEFTPDPGDLETIAHICARLDGIALAIELAAARIRVIPLDEISRRLDDRLNLLTHGTRTAAPRHRTLRGLLGWSHDLLDAQERIVFRNLAVFAGGFTLEALEAVCPADGIAKEDVFEIVSRLADKSLVVPAESQGRARFDTLETIREYARERLVDAGELDHVAGRHLEWCVSFANARNPGHDQRAMGELREEHGNIRAALSWSMGAAPEAGLRLAIAASPLWLLEGHFREGRRWLLTLDGAATGGPPHLRAEARVLAGRAAGIQGDLDEARALFEEAREVAGASGLGVFEASSLIGLGQVLQEEGKPEEALDPLQRALAIIRAENVENDPKVGAVFRWCLFALANSFLRVGTLPEARELFEEILLSARFTHDDHDLARGLTGLGNVERRNGGDLIRARDLLTEALTILRALGDRNCSTIALHGLADVAVAERDYERAEKLLGEEARLHAELEQNADIISCFEKAAKCSHARGLADRAATLAAFAATLRRASGRPQEDGGELAPLISTLRGALGDVGFDRASRAGSELTTPQALGLLAGEAGPPTAPKETAVEEPPAKRGTFRREGDVWSLEFEGKTVKLRNTKGLAYLARVLSTPWEDVHVLELVASAISSSQARVTREDSLTSQAMPDEILDAEARSSYRRRLDDLRDEIEEAESWSDVERAERAREEMNAVLEHLNAALGLGGRSRKVADEAERARKAVYMRLRQTIGKLKVEHPALGRHLERAVRTGYFCSYAPDRPTSWRL